MEKDKSRGRKHIQDKRKYKGNTVKNPKHVPLPTRPVLESNEDRYVEEKQDSLSFQLSSSTDFEILSKTPISKEHFQFKSDKLIAEEAESKCSGSVFSTDIQAIHDSILTIPFYKRIQMDDSYFSESEKTYMRREAEEHMKTILEKISSNKVKNKLQKELIQKSSTISEQADIQRDSHYILPGCTEKLKEHSEDKRTTPDNELEQWLDDILDD
nr:unnamed protein product [Callosobruchus chinensis]